jgi:hypothetical protein
LLVGCVSAWLLTIRRPAVRRVGFAIIGLHVEHASDLGSGIDNHHIKVALFDSGDFFASLYKRNTPPLIEMRLPPSPTPLPARALATADRPVRFFANAGGPD